MGNRNPSRPANVKGAANDLETLVKRVESLEKTLFRYQTFGGAIALAILVSFGVAIATVPREVAKSVVTKTATDSAEEVVKNFKENELGDLVLGKLRVQVKEIDAIEQSKVDAGVSAGRAEEYAKDAKNALKAANEFRDGAEIALKQIEDGGEVGRKLLAQDVAVKDLRKQTTQLATQLKELIEFLAKTDLKVIPTDK